MKKALISLMIIFNFSVYSFSYIHFEALDRRTKGTIAIVPPRIIVEGGFGYLKNLVVIYYFIKSAIFLGNKNTDYEDEYNAEILSKNYDQLSQIYPEFRDTYFFAQGYLPHVNSNLAEKTNSILERAILQYPSEFIYYFYQAVNLSLYMNNPQSAAYVLLEASKQPGAPNAFSYMAAMLASKGGDLSVSLNTLESLLKSTQIKSARKRYEKHIFSIKKAIVVQKAVSTFYKINSFYPEELKDLIPTYLEKLPKLDDNYQLTWKAPYVGVTIKK